MILEGLFFPTQKGSSYNKDNNFYKIVYLGPSLYIFQLGVTFLIIYKLLIKI